MNNSAMLIVVDEAIEFACRQGTAEMDLAKMAHFDLTILIHTGFMVLPLPN
jgi:hypothetical protein